MVVSAFLEPAQPGWTAVDYREWSCSEKKKLEGPRRTRFCQIDVARAERDGIALLEYKVEVDVPEGAPVDSLTQTNRHAFLVRDGVWVDVHLSKMGFEPADAALFDTVLDSIRIRP